MLFNERLKQLRGSNSQKETSAKLGIPYANYNKYETTNAEPNIETLIKIADYFDVSLDYLCGRQNKNLIFADSLSDTQKQLITIIKRLTPEQANFALGYFSNMLKIPYSDVAPSKPF